MKAYRPISLLTAFYKVASHILSTRVSGFAISNNLIPQNSLAYQKAKSASEGVRLILDTIASKNEASEDIMIIQNDFSSAYDKADKRFLMNLLHYFKFPFALVEAIGLLLSAPKVDILLNNEIILTIEALASLAQGCPLSPPLFSIITIPLIVMLQTHGPQITLKLPQIGDRLPIPNNIFFADDSLTLLNSLSELHSVIQCFDIFRSFSNLTIEVNKSTLASSKIIDISNLPQDHIDIIPSSGISHSLKFLGINIFLNPEQGSSTDANLQTLLLKTKAFCSNYKKLYLNQTGLENVAKTYLSSTVHFYTQNFFPTNSQVSENQKEINKFVLRKKYTNANQRHLPSHKGGVGLPNIPAIFLAAKSFFVKKSLSPIRSIATIIPDYILSKFGLTWNLVYSAGVGELKILVQIFLDNLSPFWSKFFQSLIDTRKALWLLDNPHHPLGKNPNSYIADNLSLHYLKKIKTSILKDLSSPHMNNPPFSIFFKELHPLLSTHYLTSHFSNLDFSPKPVNQIKEEALLLGTPATLPITDAQVTSMLSNASKYNSWPTSNSSSSSEHYFSPNSFSDMVRDNQLSRLYSRMYTALISQKGLKDMSSHQKWEKVLLTTISKDDIVKACRAIHATGFSGRIKSLLYRHAHRGFKSPKIVKRLELSQDDTCMLCGAEKTDFYHIFDECHVSSFIKLLLKEAFFISTAKELNFSPKAQNLYLQNYDSKEDDTLSYQLLGAYKFTIHMYQYKGLRNGDFCDPRIPLEITNKALTLVKTVARKAFNIQPFRKLPKVLQSTNEKTPSIYSLIVRETRLSIVNLNQNRTHLPPDPASPSAP